MMNSQPDAPGGERAQDEPTYAELARELALVREAAMDETLSDGAARAVARGTRPPTPTDIAWAEGEIAALAASPRPAEPEPPNQEATALEARIEFVRHQIQLALDGRYIDDIPTSLVRTLVLADGLFEEVLKGKK